MEQAVTAMCAFTEHHELKQRWSTSQIGPDTLLCLSAVQPHSVAMEVFSAQVFSSEFINQTSIT